MRASGAEDAAPRPLGRERSELVDVEATEIDVWHIPLQAPDTSVAKLLLRLSPDDRTRATSFATPDLRRRFIIAHAALRSILGAVLGCPPDEVQIVRRACPVCGGAHGKPIVLRPRPIEFSLARTKGNAVVATDWGRSVGVDVEAVTDLVEQDLVALERYVSRPHSGPCSTTQHQARVRQFYETWTGVEALVKATGMGLHGPLDEIGEAVVAARDGGRAATIRHAGRDWSLVHFEPAPDVCGALAVEGFALGVRLHRWEFGLA